MTNEMQTEKSFQRFLPWILFAAALLFYLLTMGWGMAPANLGMVAELSGWNWPQNTLPPILAILTIPLRWFPMAVLPFCLNAFSAFIGALALGLLARSVMLLPHDRTQGQRDRERSDYSFLTIPAAWLPPVLAVLACGLQLTFWVASVDGTGVIIDALLFVYPIRCLLEYRVDGRETWALKAALVFGLGMANHWLMFAFLPLYIVAWFWVKGVSFFNLGFLTRIIGLGLLGALFCLLMPIAQGLSAGSPSTTGEALQSFLIQEKDILLNIPLRSLWVLGLTSVLPVAILGIRWASSFGDNSPLGVALARFMFHLVHGVFLIVCVWGAFDSPLSPQVFSREVGDINPFFSIQLWLPLYILAALSIGYYSGYFLLVFDNRSRAARHETDLIRLLNTAATAALWACLFVVPIGLVCKNLPSVRASGGNLFAEFGRNLVSTLPKEGAVLLSDDPLTMLLARASLGAGGHNFLFLNTPSLVYPPYHEFVRHKQPELWSGELGKLPRTNEISPAVLIDLMSRLSTSHELYYLHPSFGYYFERFYAQQHGLAYRLQLYPTNAVLPPPIATSTVNDNVAFWKRLDAGQLDNVARKLPLRKSEKSLRETLFGLIKARMEPDDVAIQVGEYYSRALNGWGASLQAREDFAGAGWCFRRALDVNPLNVVADINQLCNASLRAGGYRPADLTKGLSERLNQYADPGMLLSVNGPFDEPRFCHQEGVFFTKAAHYRQAAWQFNRVKDLNPNDPAAYIWLAQIYNLWREPDEALALINEARSLPAIQTNRPVELVTVEATSYFAKKDFAAAEDVLLEAMREKPDDLRLENSAVPLLINFQRLTAASQVVDRRLKQSPNDLQALGERGVIDLRLGHFAAAIPYLDRILQAQPTNYVAMLNRAIALLQIDRLDEAQRDYATMSAAFPKDYQIYYGLGEIAYRRKDYATAINNYGSYLKYALANSDEARMVRKRLDEMKSASP